MVASNLLSFQSWMNKASLCVCWRISWFVSGCSEAFETPRQGRRSRHWHRCRSSCSCCQARLWSRQLARSRDWYRILFGSADWNITQSRNPYDSWSALFFGLIHPVGSWRLLDRIGSIARSIFWSSLSCACKESLFAIHHFGGAWSFRFSSCPYFSDRGYIRKQIKY